MKRRTRALFRMNIIRISCIFIISACVMTTAVCVLPHTQKYISAGTFSSEEVPDNPRAMSNAELVLLSRFVAIECKDEPFICKVAVAAVIINRKISPLFPPTVESAVFDVDDFDSIRDGTLYDDIPGDESVSARRAVLLAIDGNDPTCGATCFEKRDSPDAGRVRPFLRVGNMIFGERQ